MMKRIIFSVLLLAFTAAHCAANEEANRTGNQGLALVNEGKMEEGLSLIKRATEISPEDASWRMNYGSILMVSAQKNSGQPEKMKELLNQSEKELVSAIGLFKEAKDNMLRAQCYFLLGDIYYFPYQDRGTAKKYYQEATREYPEHGGAAEALKRYDFTS